MAKTLWLRAAVMGLSAGLSFGGASFAQGVPAEIPPSSYSGDQYVDSRGCVFVRVGFGATTEWIPRVGRDRQAVCGYTPTGGGGQAAPDLAATAGVTVIGGTAPAPEPAPAPAAAPVVAAAPQVRVPAAPAPVTVVAPAVHGATGCPNLPAAQQPYFTGTDVRCGPQAIHPGDQRPIGPQSGSGYGYGADVVTVTGTPRSFALSAPPAGYQLAWDDGRLNPYRGLGTAQGEQQMAQVWTNTVPRRAAPIVLGTRAAPPDQRYALGDGDGNPQGDAVPGTVDAGDRVPRARVPAPDTPAAPANEVRVGAGHRHVLAGTFGAQADAAAAYNRLASAGLPARIGQIQRQGATMFVVMAGPYGDPQSLGRAVLQARSAGFPGAVTRN